jgi:hypothetical protein
MTIPFLVELEMGKKFLPPLPRALSLGAISLTGIPSSNKLFQVFVFELSLPAFLSSVPSSFSHLYLRGSRGYSSCSLCSSCLSDRRGGLDRTGVPPVFFFCLKVSDERQDRGLSSP